MLTAPPDTPASLDELKPVGDGDLSAWTKAGGGTDTPCVIAPLAQYRGVENQLYRVEIHSGAGDDGVTFKWSRDNGSLIYPVDRLGDRSAVLAHLGRDAWTTITENNWVEYADDALIARHGAGLLAKVTVVDRDERTVTLDWARALRTYPRSPIRTSIRCSAAGIIAAWPATAQSRPLPATRSNLRTE